MTSRLRIIVTGLIAQHPSLGGVTWDYLQYPVGLARLGHDVFYFEDSGEWPYTLDGGASGIEWIARDPSRNVEHLARTMDRYGLGERWAYHFPTRPRWYGLSHRKRREVMATADLVLNVSGTLRRPQDYRQAHRLAYIDSDPVFTQVKLLMPRSQRKFQKRVAAHDVFFSFGERFSADTPRTGHMWLPTRQPIVLSEWRPSAPRRDVYTTVMSWTSYRPLRHGGRTYAQKDVEFMRFLDLPGRVAGAELEVALGMNHHTAWQTAGAADDLTPEVRALVSLGATWTPHELLARAGWRTADSLQACGDLDSYRAYIESSRAEWSVAKNGYVRGQSGWFSCRSACYLAAGRPVVVQETGFSSVLPVGEGILPYRTPDEAAEAIRAVEADYPRHARAARSIAEEFFDSDRVLTRLVDDAMTGGATPRVEPAPAVSEPPADEPFAIDTFPSRRLVAAGQEVDT
jgi:hypothetical protein